MKRVILDSVGATWGVWYWPIWLSVVVASFLGPEVDGLVDNSANTLSAWVWRALKISSNESFAQWGAVNYLVFGAWMVLISWLTFHFFFGMFH